MGPFSCIKRNKEKKANHSRMPCTNCMAEYTLRRKEHGCSKCGFGFCERCVSHRFVIPALSPKPVPVCASCYHLLTNKKDADERGGETSCSAKCRKPILARREKSREFPLPTTMSDNDNSWGDDRLPPPSLRSLYPQQQQRQPKRANGGGGGGDEKWADLEARLARLNDPNQFEQPAPEQSATSKGGKNQREPTKKEPAPPIEELEERLAALRGIPVDLVRKPRLLVMSEDDDDVSDVVLNDEAAQLLRKAELGYPVTSGCGGGRNAAGMQDDMSTNSNNSESSSVLQNVIADALKAPSARSSTSELSKMATSDQPLYPSFAECIRRTLEDAKAAEHEAMEFIRRHEAAPQNPGPRTDTKHEHK